MNPKSLAAALSIGRGSVVSLVGAGGKTTTMYRLCNELAEAGLRVISTTTTHIQRPHRSQSSLLLALDEIEDLSSALRESFERSTHLTVVRSRGRADKLEGVGLSAVGDLAEHADALVIEADGARHKLLKAPALHEPAVSQFTTPFLVVAGLSALGRPLAEVCHRPEIAAELLGCSPDSTVTTETVAGLVSDPAGGLKGKPGNAAAWCVLTHMSPENRSAAWEIARMLPAGAFEGVVGIRSDGSFKVLAADTQDL